MGEQRERGFMPLQRPHEMVGSTEADAACNSSAETA
jgi:hypothetical protein